MNSLLFFGTLRSKKLLKSVIGRDLNHLKFSKIKLTKSKLFKVENENFPYLEKTNSYKDFINCTYIEGLIKKDFEKILFYESIEYKLSSINLVINEIIVETHFFELINKNITSELWSFNKWKIKYEVFSCIAAEEWMTLFNKYKNNPEKAELYWDKILENAKIRIKE